MHPHFGNLSQNSKYKKQLHKKYLQYSIDLHILWYMWCHGARNFIAIFFIYRSFTILPFLLFTHRENTINYTTTNFSTKYYIQVWLQCNSLIIMYFMRISIVKYFPVHVFCTFTIHTSSFSRSFKFSQFSL